MNIPRNISVKFVYFESGLASGQVLLLPFSLFVDCGVSWWQIVNWGSVKI